MASFVLANANGLHETQMFPDKPRRFLQHLLNANADFAFVTETHFTPESNPWKLIHGAVFSSFRHKQRGCALIPIRRGVKFSNTQTDPEGRWIVATMHVNHFPPLRLCGIYAPNSKQDEFIRRVLSSAAADASVLLGDFNFVTRVVDRSPSAQLDSVAVSCLDAISSAGFSDIAPLKSPHNFIHRNGQFTARLDRCYVRKSSHISAALSLSFTDSRLPIKGSRTMSLPWFTFSHRSRFQEALHFGG